MKPRYSHIFMMLVMLIITICVALLYVYMHYAVGRSVNKALVAESIVAAQEASNAQQKTTEQIYQDTVDQRAKLSEFFVSDDAAVAFIESLESLGPGSGSTVVLGNVAADDTSALAAGTLAHIKAHVDASGTWSSVMRTLMLAEVLPYQSSIDNVRLTSSGSSDPKVGTEWHVSFDVSAGLIVHNKKP